MRQWLVKKRSGEQDSLESGRDDMLRERLLDFALAAREPIEMEDERALEVTVDVLLELDRVEDDLLIALEMDGDTELAKLIFDERLLLIEPDLPAELDMTELDCAPLADRDDDLADAFSIDDDLMMIVELDLDAERELVELDLVTLIEEETEEGLAELSEFANDCAETLREDEAVKEVELDLIAEEVGLVALTGIVEEERLLWLVTLVELTIRCANNGPHSLVRTVRSIGIIWALAWRLAAGLQCVRADPSQ